MLYEIRGGTWGTLDELRPSDLLEESHFAIWPEAISVRERKANYASLVCEIVFARAEVGNSLRRQKYVIHH
jgi:hypothetical protein